MGILALKLWARMPVPLLLSEGPCVLQQVSSDDAQKQLHELIAEAVKGETILITTDEGQAVQLVPVAYPARKRQFGSAKGLIHMADDFDAPLEDFSVYMP